MSIKKTLLFSALVLSGLNFLPAQNLVVNPGFEDVGGLDDGSHEIRDVNLPNWTDPTAGSSDVMVSGRKKNKRRRYAWTSVADSGKACAGFYASRNGSNWAEYIQGTLSKALVKGNIYHFSVAIKPQVSSDNPEVINYIGISFSVDSRADLADEHQSIGLTPELIVTRGTVDHQSNGWDRYTQDYKAKGGEMYFIIGTFNPHGNSHNNGYDNSPYFYCDDFAVISSRPLGPIPDYVFTTDTLDDVGQFIPIDHHALFQLSNSENGNNYGINSSFASFIQRLTLRRRNMRTRIHK